MYQEYAHDIAQMLMLDEEQVGLELNAFNVLGMSGPIQIITGLVNFCKKQPEKTLQIINYNKQPIMEIKEGGMVIIKGDNIENGGIKIVHDYKGYSCNSMKPLTDEELQERIKRVREHIGNVNRLWFPVCKYMMLRNAVAEGDFATAVRKLKSLYPELNLNADDISSLNVLSFRKPFAEWDPEDAPVHGKTYNKYYAIAQLLQI